MVELPEDEKIQLLIDDSAEMTLHERAHKIKSLYRDEVKEFLFNSNLTFEQIRS